MSEALLRYADAVRETACHFTELGALLNDLRIGGPRTKKVNGQQLKEKILWQREKRK